MNRRQKKKLYRRIVGENPAIWMSYRGETYKIATGIGKCRYKEAIRVVNLARILMKRRMR